MPDISNTYRNRLLKKQLEYSREFKTLFDDIGNQFAQIAYDPNIRFVKAFVFPPYIKARMKAIIADFHDQALQLTEDEITNAWELSNQKNDKIITDYLSTISAIKASQAAAYFLPNTSALKAFLSSEHGTDTLSDSIWQVGKQLRAELEAHLSIGITNGDSAAVISQRIRQYLNNPDALFRRVRDNNGRLIASKKMLENHPGQGVYNSAYKNALRIARTNTNQAYLLADHIRWAQLDMVKGVRIELSAQHPDYNYPEICEECEGYYPKDFIFVGWHPSCLCHAVAILSSEEDFMAYLGGADKELNGAVSIYPDGFQNFVNDNFERFSNYKSVPFWLDDNMNIIKELIK